MNNIIKVIKLYAVVSSNENKPNPIPLFQTKYRLKKRVDIDIYFIFVL